MPRLIRCSDSVNPLGAIFPIWESGDVVRTVEELTQGFHSHCRHICPKIINDIIQQLWPLQISPRWTWRSRHSAHGVIITRMALNCPAVLRERRPLVPRQEGPHSQGRAQRALRVPSSSVLSVDSLSCVLLGHFLLLLNAEVSFLPLIGPGFLLWPSLQHRFWPLSPTELCFCAPAEPGRRDIYSHGPPWNPHFSSHLPFDQTDTLSLFFLLCSGVIFFLYWRLVPYLLSFFSISLNFLLSGDNNHLFIKMLRSPPSSMRQRQRNAMKLKTSLVLQYPRRVLFPVWY